MAVSPAPARSFSPSQPGPGRRAPPGNENDFPPGHSGEWEPPPMQSEECSLFLVFLPDFCLAMGQKLFFTHREHRSWPLWTAHGGLLVPKKVAAWSKCAIFWKSLGSFGGV